MLISRSFLTLTSSMTRCIEMQRKMEKSSTGVFSVSLKLYPGRYEVGFNDRNEFDIILCYPVMYQASHLFSCRSSSLLMAYGRLILWGLLFTAMDTKTIFSLLRKSMSLQSYFRMWKINRFFVVKGLQILLSWKLYQAAMVASWQLFDHLVLGSM